MEDPIPEQDENLVFCEAKEVRSLGACAEMCFEHATQGVAVRRLSCPGYQFKNGLLSVIKLVARASELRTVKVQNFVKSLLRFVQNVVDGGMHQQSTVVRLSCPGYHKNIMSKLFYVGSYRDDAINDPNRGWIVGTFKEDYPRKNEDLEIKYWEYKAGSTDHPTKQSSIIECTFVLKGKTKAVIDGEDVILAAGQYVVIAPGVPNNTVVEILEDAAGLTIKAPSDPSAKEVLEG